MKTGVILKLNNGNAVVLDGSGTFRTVAARSSWRTGDVVPLPGLKKRVRWALPLAACLVLALAASGGWLWFTPAALVSLDVNPAVELTLNRFDRVVGAAAMNEEGARLLEESSVKGLAADQAVSVLLESAYLTPYLARENYVALTVQAEDTALEERLLPLVEETAYAAAPAGTKVSCHGVDAGTVAAAHGCGVTAGKYLALMELQEADPDIDVSEYAHCGIGEIEEQAARCHAATNGGGMGGAVPEVGAGAGSGCGLGNGHGHHH